jgi:hypothetical protein
MKLMATDGPTLSHRKTAAKFESNICDTGEDSGGIVFILPGFSRDNSPPNGIQITCGRLEPGMNVFTWELVTQLIGLHFSNKSSPLLWQSLTTHVPLPVPIEH